MDLKPNDQSAKTTSKATNDGSYNLASTVLQGNGVGVAQLAMQMVTLKSVESTFHINKILAHLYHLVLTTCISKEELDITDFYTLDNNVYCLRGLDPNNTGVQCNIYKVWWGIVRGSW